jgi:hypothetical protein
MMSFSREQFLKCVSGTFTHPLLLIIRSRGIATKYESLEMAMLPLEIVLTCSLTEFYLLLHETLATEGRIQARKLRHDAANRFERPP